MKFKLIKGEKSLNTNEKAIALLEQNEYQEAFTLFKQAVEESRDVQSLTNLAHIYMYEEEDVDEVIHLLKEVLRFQPHSHFPYSLLGEGYVRTGQWSKAREVLRKALAIQPTLEATFNLATAEYCLGNLEEAVNYFLEVSNGHKYAIYDYIQCLIELGRREEAKRRLEDFLQTAEEIETVQVAELYTELGCFQEAILFFEKGWNEYGKMEDWVSKYMYVLLRNGQHTRAHELLQEVIQEVEEIMDSVHEEECCEVWTEKDKAERIQELIIEKEEWKSLMERISANYTPKLTFETDFLTACYLFGCKRHNNPEYKMEKGLS
ncbi:tetratricopeptide repeat protein [Bacillus manliponensis]